MLRTDDGVVINVINKGVACRSTDGQTVSVRTLPVFEPPLGKGVARQERLCRHTRTGGRSGVPAVRIRFTR
jgi:hypothetical protein